jgi:hypothetical protein
MTAVGVTGHRTLADPARWAWVHDEIERALIDAGPPLDGVSSLAEGADQCFAEVVLAQGGRLHAVIAFDGFAATIDAPSARACFDSMLAQADTVEVVPPTASREEGYLAAGLRVVELSDVIIAVWDGLAARGVGGTAQIVEYARNKGRRLVHIDTTSWTVHP